MFTIGYVYTNNKFLVFRFITIINAQYLFFIVALGPIAQCNNVGYNYTIQCNISTCQVVDLIHHQHCQRICQKSLNLPTLFLLLEMEPLPSPTWVEDMTNIYNTILVNDGPNFLEVLLVFSSGEYL